MKINPFMKRTPFPLKNGEVVFISPGYFIKLVANYYGYSSVKEFHIGNKTDNAKVDLYVKEMKKGNKFPMPYIDVTPDKFYGFGAHGFGAQGIHRALASKKLGLKKIPVYRLKKYNIPFKTLRVESDYDL